MVTASLNLHSKMFLTILLCLFASFVLLRFRAQALSDNPLRSNEVLVIAHQGGERLFPSNTLFAFEQALGMGVDVLELDIHLSQDDHIVVIHDDSVDRTTNGSGLISEMSLTDIQALDAGHYWTEDGENYPYREQGIYIPRLKEVFDITPRTVPMAIEIKPSERDIVGPFCELLASYGRKDSVIVGSFHAEVLRAFRGACPEVATSMTPDEVRSSVLLSLAFLGSLSKPQALAAQVPMASGAIPVTTERYVRDLHSKEVAIHVWTINDITTMQELIAWGVDGIITDRPDLLLELLRP